MLFYCIKSLKVENFIQELAKTRTFLAFYEIQIRNITNSKSHGYIEKKNEPVRIFNRVRINSLCILFIVRRLFTGKKEDERFFNIDEQYSLNIHFVGEIRKFNTNLTESGLPVFRSIYSVKASTLRDEP